METNKGTTLEIKTEIANHRGEKRIKLMFTYDAGLIQKVKAIHGARWSKTMGCWHVPFTKESIKNIENANLQTKENVQIPIHTEKKQIPETHLPYFEKFKDYINYKRYSANTLRVYVSMIKIFFEHFQFPSPEEITGEHIIKFNREYILNHWCPVKIIIY